MHFIKSMRNFLLLLLGLAAVYSLGLGIRRAVLEAQFVKFGADLPFTLESALEFRYVRMVFDGAGLPRIDRKVQAPEGVNVRATYTIAAEYAYAWLARWLPARLSLTDRVRWISAGWFCLGIPFLCLWLWWWLRSGWAAALGGAYYAVGLAAVMRATGQELSHENFALPLLLAHLAAGALAARLAAPGARRAVAGLAALLLAAALCSWDLIQFYVVLWAAAHYCRMVGGRYFGNRHRAEQWGLIVLALLLAGIANPYLRAHAFWRAPALLLVCGMLPGVWAQARGRWPARSAQAWALRLLPLALAGAGLALAGAYGEAYTHFGELLWAKLRFLNQKPAEPALLTFAQRILWVPALNSVNWDLTRMMFPAIIPAVLGAIVLILFSTRPRSDPEIVHLLFYFIAAAAAFALFMRFHVFLALFAAALLGWLGGWCARQSGWLRAALLALLISVMAAEAAHTVGGAAQWGAAPAYLRQQRELTRWLRENITEDPVLANFGLSAWLLADGGFPIVLHPKFENAAIRRRVQTYGELLFKGRERDLRDWADGLGVQYYVYALGEFTDRRIDCQMRYFADALNPPAGAPARMFEYQHLQGRYFKFLWGNEKYRVFRMITGGAQRQADELAGQARDKLTHGAAAEAETLAQAALLHDPHNTNAAQILLRLDALQH